ncbi:MAG TPA: phage holin family protein [Chloroflexota bacterium]|nr:phage holin family protein [Chloroflexota bacterium]
MSRLFVNWLAIVIAVWLAARFFPAGKVVYTGLEGLAVFALVLGLLNAFVAPIIRFLTFPITLVTLGLFSLVINALMFWFAASLSGGVGVSSFLWAFVAALFVSIINLVVANLLA